jgi:hypothetical protein
MSDMQELSCSRQYELFQSGVYQKLNLSRIPKSLPNIPMFTPLYMREPKIEIEKLLIRCS